MLSATELTGCCAAEDLNRAELRPDSLGVPFCDPLSHRKLRRIVFGSVKSIRVSLHRSAQSLCRFGLGVEVRDLQLSSGDCVLRAPVCLDEAAATKLWRFRCWVASDQQAEVGEMTKLKRGPGASRAPGRASVVRPRARLRLATLQGPRARSTVQASHLRQFERPS